MKDVINEFRLEARDSFAWLESIVADISPEQATSRPPGNANTIASTYAHIVRNVDEDINQHFFERPMLNEGEWRGRTGLIPGRSDWGSRDEHRLAGAASLWPGHPRVPHRDDGRLTEADLDRDVDMSTPTLGMWKGIEVVRLTVSRHVRMHGGEIAALKGIQGMKGYLAGLDADDPSQARTTMF